MTPLVDERPRQDPQPCTADTLEHCRAKHHHKVQEGYVHCGQPDAVPPRDHYEEFYREYPLLDPRNTPRA